MKLARLNDKPEIFFSIQGEGVSAGCPAIFVRLALCNLHCVWCDTAYTWNFAGTVWGFEKSQPPGNCSKKTKQESIAELSASELARLVALFPCRRIVITGGEPMLQQAEIVELINELGKISEDYFFEIETNGTIVPGPQLAEKIGQFNISPKLENSLNSKELRENKKTLEFFSTQPAQSKSWFKFVVDSAQDLAEITELIDRHGLQKNRVLLMPQGRTSAELNQRAGWLVEECKVRGFRFSDRLHIRLWGDKKGV